MHEVMKEDGEEGTRVTIRDEADEPVGLHDLISKVDPLGRVSEEEKCEGDG